MLAAVGAQGGRGGKRLVKRRGCRPGGPRDSGLPSRGRGRRRRRRRRRVGMEGTVEALYG